MPRVVRGGGDEIIRRAVAVASAIMFGLLVVPNAASADVITVLVPDAVDDVPVGWDFVTGEPTYQQLSSRTPMSLVGYLDIVSYELSFDTVASTYTFTMTLNGDLPTEGDGMPLSGAKFVEWAMGIDPANWNPVSNPVTPLYMITITYDGVSYDAYVMDCTTLIITSLGVITVDGATLFVSFPSSSIDELAGFWWFASTRVWYGEPDTYGFRFADFTDFDACPGDSGYDIPWFPEA